VTLPADLRSRLEHGQAVAGGGAHGT
jgi:hypothetical protein